MEIRWLFLITFIAKNYASLLYGNILSHFTTCPNVPFPSISIIKYLERKWFKNDDKLRFHIAIPRDILNRIIDSEYIIIIFVIKPFIMHPFKF